MYFNQGNSRQFQEMRFGEQSSATYGLDVGDLDGDGFLDIVTATPVRQLFFIIASNVNRVKDAIRRSASILSFC